MTAWLDEYGAARGALKRLDAAREELDARYRRGFDFMQQTGAVLGSAVAHVGIGAAAEDVQSAERDLDVAVRALLDKLAQEIRP